MIFVQDFSVICSLGKNKIEARKNLKNGASPGLRARTDLLLDQEEAYFGCCDGNLPEIPEVFSGMKSRNNQLLLSCYLAERENFQKVLTQYNPSKVAVILGTSTSGSSEADKYIGSCLEGEHPDFQGTQQELGSPALFLSSYLHFSGPAFCISTACTSSTRTFISAAKMLNAGIIDAAIVGGVDTLARMPINGFNALKALSAQVCRPFVNDRSGITIGEGAALFLLTRETGPLQLLGFGETSDGNHMTAPRADGLCAAAAMKEAIERARLKPEDIGYVNLHGTGTQLNDTSEMIAMRQVFANKVPCSSTKNLTGHTLGAAGAVEAAILCLLLTEEAPSIPAQGEAPSKYQPSDIETGLVIDATLLSKKPMMTNNFAFGGNNASLIIGVSHA